MTSKTKTLGLMTGLAVFILLSLSFKSSDNQSETIMIRSTQIAFMGKNNSFIRIYKGDKQTESIQLDKWSLDNEENNYDKLITTVRTYEKQGFQVISQSETMFGTNGFVNTFILTKK